MESDIILLLPREVVIEQIIPKLNGDDIVSVFIVYDEYREYLWYNRLTEVQKYNIAKTYTKYAKLLEEENYNFPYIQEVTNMPHNVTLFKGGYEWEEFVLEYIKEDKVLTLTPLLNCLAVYDGIVLMSHVIMLGGIDSVKYFQEQLRHYLDVRARHKVLQKVLKYHVGQVNDNMKKNIVEFIQPVLEDGNLSTIINAFECYSSEGSPSNELVMSLYFKLFVQSYAQRMVDTCNVKDNTNLDKDILYILQLCKNV